MKNEELKINIRELIFYLNIGKGSVISVVGAGGKTTLVQSLANALAKNFKVGVLTTTKIMKPDSGDYTGLYIGSVHPEDVSGLGNGIYYFARESMDNGKLWDVDEASLDTVRNAMDVLLIEADGSKCKPLKGWAEFEPVVLKETTMTIGVITVKELGRVISDENVHRMSLFEKLAGAKAGQKLLKQHLISMITKPEGLFKNSVGEKVLLFNQVEDDAAERLANEIVEEGNLPFEKIIIGCLR